MRTRKVEGGGAEIYYIFTGCDSDSINITEHLLLLILNISVE